jgi:hypothetical protein
MALLYRYSSSSSAFTLLPNSSRSSSSILLFAKGSSKKKTKTRNGSSGSSKGFGIKHAVVSNDDSTTATTADAAAVATTPRTTKQVERMTPSSIMDASSTTTATAEIIEATYVQDYLEQEIRNALPSRPGQLVQVSSSPLIFTVDDFIDPALCRKIDSNGKGCYDLWFPESLSAYLFRKQESELDCLMFNAVSSLDHDDKKGQYYPDGLHLDTNNQCLERHVTAILYLNDVPEECGGATVFPLARTLPDDPVLAASKRLLAQQITHTRNLDKQQGRAKVGTQEDEESLKADACLLETRVGTNFEENPKTNTKIRIQPKAGKLLLFFSRLPNGEQDPRSWHAGERIHSTSDAPVTEKKILTLLKEVDYTDDTTTTQQPRREENSLEAYLAPQIREQQTWLKEKASMPKN